VVLNSTKRKKKSPARPEPIAPSATPWTQHRLWTALTYLFGLLPLCLLWNGNNAFYLDWRNHLWIIGYFGEYFRQHWTFPITINTDQVAGLPYPIFYGYLFFPAAGLISSFTGCAFALRLVCSLVFLLQVRQVSKTVETIAGNRFVAGAVTVLVSFATYPLTNLYNRTAIPEFIAASLVLSVCMMWLRIVRMNDPQRRLRLVLGAALVLAMAMGTHPITAILGTSMVCLLVLVSLPFVPYNRDLLKTVGVAAVLIAIVIAPWVYAVARYAGKVQIAGGWLYFFPKSLDRFFTRFFPLPWDPRMGTPELIQWGTPYLDTQINFGMLILAIYLLYRVLRQGGAKGVRESRIGFAAFAGFALVCVASLSELFWVPIPNSLKFIQFAYRLVTYADLFLLLAVLFLLAGMRRIAGSPDRPLIAVLAVCLTLSTASVALKLMHAHRAEEPNVLAGSEWPDTDRDALRMMPPTFYGVNGYAVKSGVHSILADNTVLSPASFPIGIQQHFGEVLPVPVFSNFGLIRTNVQIFPWNRVVWNGREIPFEETSTNQDLITIVSTKPGAGTLGYIVRPEPVWVVLRILSLWTFALWAVALPGLRYWRTRKV
jgi:hypothetical protein